MYRLYFICLLAIIGNNLSAQQKIVSNSMNFINANDKKFMIFYNDSLYKGSSEFKQLFYRNNDPELMYLYRKHQSNKIWGDVLNFVGTVGMAVGAVNASNGKNSSERTIGWVSLGAGFGCAAIGNILNNAANYNLTKAVFLFNTRYNKRTAYLGISDKELGIALTLQF